MTNQEIANQIKEQVKPCTHENEKLNQGDGFVYVTCEDCGDNLF
jgi:ribosomal protein S27E